MNERKTSSNLALRPEMKRKEPGQSLKSIPFVSINFLLLGIFHSSSKFWRFTFDFVASLLHLGMSYVVIRYDVRMEPSIFSFSICLHHCMGMSAFLLLMRKKSEIRSFLTSNSSLAPKLRKIDILWPLAFSVPVILEYVVLYLHPRTHYKGRFAIAALDHSPTLQLALVHLCFIVYMTWFELEPLCLILYSLGYCVLYNYKFDVVSSIFYGEHVNTFPSILLKFQSVTRKQQQFESVFGPFLLISLCYNFISTVFFIYLLNVLLINPRSYDLYHVLTGRLFLQAVSVGLIFVISIYDNKLKKFSRQIADQLELKLAECSAKDFLVITYLQRKIDSSINKPLTACEMVTIQRHVILTIATSCVTFAVLLIQINNGALNIKN